MEIKKNKIKKNILSSIMIALVGIAVIGTTASILNKEDNSNNVSEIKYEAEDYLFNDKSNSLYPYVLNSSNASNGKVVGYIDTCGQGVSFVHYAKEGSEFTLKIGYYTQILNSKHDVFVDGNYQNTITYSRVNDWVFNSNSSALIEEITINLHSGYNTISIIKNGEKDDPNENSYGGYVQLDYFIVSGKNTVENPVLDFTYKIEAEFGSYHSSASAPVKILNASNNYVVGGIDNAGDGVEFVLNNLKTGYYSLKLVYSKDFGERPVNVIFNNKLTEINLKDYDNQSFSNFNTSEEIINLYINSNSTNILKIERANNSNWFCLDSIILNRVY